MAAFAQGTFKIFRTVLKQVYGRSFCNVMNKTRTGLHVPVIRTGGLLCAGGVILSETNDFPDKKSNKLKAVDPETLTSSYLIRNAASANVDSATTLLTQIATTLLQLHNQYVEALEQLGRLQEMGVEAHGGGVQEDRVWDAVLIVRKKISDIKAAKHELEILYASVERLMNNSAEVAFLSGADDACTIANERLFTVKDKLNAAIKNSRKGELALSQREAWVIKETAQREEELKAKALSQPVIPLVESEAGPEILANGVGQESANAPTGTDSHTVPTENEVDDWFTVILGDDTGGKSESTQHAENTDFTQDEEDERKWANAM